MSAPVIHVGHVKTATTTLQTCLFARHPGICYLGRPYKDCAVAELVDLIKKCDSLCYDATRAAELFRQAVAPKLGGDRVVLLSEEHFSYNRQGTDRGLMASRLRSLFGPAKAILTIRNQADALASFFIRHDHKNKACPSCQGQKSVAFAGWLAYSIDRLDGGFLRYLRYDEQARNLAEVFGPENVGIFLYEELAQNRERFVCRLCEFIGIDSKEGIHLVADHRLNPRTSSRQAAYQHFRERLLPGVGLGRLVPASLRRTATEFLSVGVPESIELSPRQLTLIADFFRESNAGLAREFGLPLEEWGYAGLGMGSRVEPTDKQVSDLSGPGSFNFKLN